jgi:hypothetical protein
MSFNATWEGSGCGYVTVFEDDDRYRMYYKAWHLPVGEDGVVADGSSLHICYAESPDGIHWERPEFGLFEHDGSTANNIVFTGPGSHGFAPFKDPNPEALPEARYKAFGHGKDRDARVIWAHCSPDGVHWSRMREEPVMDCCAFDSQNLAFFDETRGEYRAYVRDFTGERIGQGLRGIKTATSPDFLNWTEPEWLGYPGAPDEQLYTNQVHPCARAPQIFIGLPARYVERGWSPSMRALPDPENREMRARTQERYGTALSDSLLMTSRDGRTFNRWGRGLRAARYPAARHVGLRRSLLAVADRRDGVVAAGRAARAFVLLGRGLLAEQRRKPAPLHAAPRWLRGAPRAAVGRGDGHETAHLRGGRAVPELRDLSGRARFAWRCRTDPARRSRA